MPQFDLEVFSAQIFWLVIFFAILTTYTAAVSVPRLRALLEERWQKTDGYRIEAGRLSDKKKATLTHVDVEISQARKEAHEIISASQSDVIADFDERKNTMLVMAKQHLVEAEARLMSEKENALTEIKEHTQIITQEILEKVLPLAANDSEIQSQLNDKLNAKVSNGA